MTGTGDCHERHGDYTWQEKDMAFNPGIAEALKWLTDNGFTYRHF
ncbi:MAG: hypothetical protein U0X76_02150 [Bacteroidia bacterium]